MSPLSRVLMALACMLGSSVGALAQGVAPGGPIGNSTGIGSGLGGVTGGTGPSWPNGTNQAPQPSYTPPPPGGITMSPSPAPSLSTTQPSYYPQPRTPREAGKPRPP